ncbi:DNA-binding response regulator [Vibrio sp. VGrn 2]|uniref:response regulator transcription factor n=1 Tax=Vibrio sp. VGrn 2 TaxID=2419839 RepID=UPI00128DB725|nr:response regulator transcription factor [Vibrio sp. VGrn 2]MPS41554.1 DNA-binding response regulator [Vibrio sp. VGrn 2]
MYRDLYLLTNKGLNGSLLFDFFKSKLNLSITLINTSEHDFLSIKENSIILLDCSLGHEYIISLLARLKYNSSNTALALINSSDDLTVARAAEFNNLSGVFYSNDDTSLICKGIKEILRGNLWFSRDFSQRYIEHLRKSKYKDLEEDNLLTPKERQLLLLISNGLSNKEVSTKLGVTENTIKSHMYNIFKKLGVKSRVQAIVRAQVKSLI